MTKTNPDVAIQFAMKLMIDGQDRKAFNAAMRAEFPRITDYMLRETYQAVKILRAIQQVRNTDHDES